MMAKVALWTCDYRFESGFSSKIAGSSDFKVLDRKTDNNYPLAYNSFSYF